MLTAHSVRLCLSPFVLYPVPSSLWMSRDAVPVLLIMFLARQALSRWCPPLIRIMLA